MANRTPLGIALLAALVAQRWDVLQGLAEGLVLAISPARQVFTLDDAILEDAELEPFLVAQIDGMMKDGGLVWPWPRS